MSNRLLPPLLIALASTSATAQIGRSSLGNADVPVSRVVLFSSGVGYFEHSGMMHGNGATELRFKTSQINDILKSLVLQDQGGGRVGVITYPSQDPLAKTLRSFQVDITRNPSLADLLNQLRGARVLVQTKGERVDGTILGVESRTMETERGEAVMTPVLNLLSGASIRAIDLPSIASLSLEDQQLQEELTKALATLVQARDQDKKPVTINFTGTGDRRVRIGYVVETPVWKASYRLVLGDRGTSAMLQGWAIVENQTETDWNDVSLNLVSGRPISFIMDLYQPLYATRPTVVPELFAGLRPQVYEGAVATADTMRVGLKERGASSVERRRIGYGADGRPVAMQLSEVVVTGSNAANGPIDIAASVEAIASSGALGDLFQYSVPNVTLARQKSAMLPIISDTVPVERLSIYNAAVLQSNPLHGVLLKNRTGKSLLQGPLTVLVSGGYAGDARIDNVPAGQERLLSYGIDLDIAVDANKTRQTQAVTASSIRKGILTISRKLISTQEYAAHNKSSHDKMLVIEHPVRTNWKLVDTQTPFETTPHVYRFKGDAPANKVTVLVVKEEYASTESIMLLMADPGQLLTYSRTGEISPAVREALARAVEMKQGVVDIERQIAAKTQQIAEITAEQDRIRENMKTVTASGQYYERLLGKLNEQESTIEKAQAERASLTARRDEMRRELEDYLAKVTAG